MSSQRGKWAGGVPPKWLRHCRQSPFAVELDQRRDHVVLGQDALGSRRQAKQTFARAARWSMPGHQAA